MSDDARDVPALSLRDRKAADTRDGLLEARLRRLDSRPLSDIPVKELCQEVGVSQATFFNYFGGKEDLILFFLGLWSVDMAATAAAHDPADPLGAIEAIFLSTAAQSDAHPGILAEIIALQARTRVQRAGPAPTDADLLRAFPERPELLAAPRDAGLDSLIPPLVVRAVALGHLPPHTDPGEVLVATATIFFGAAVLRRQAPDLPAEVAYRRQLRRLWTALRAT